MFRSAVFSSVVAMRRYIRVSDGLHVADSPATGKNLMTAEFKCQRTFSNSIQNRFRQMCLGLSYRRLKADGGDSESRAFGEGEHAVSAEEEQREEEEGEAAVSLFPSSQETGEDLTPWRRHGERERVR